VSAALDLTGQRFGLLLVLSKDGNKWYCQCDYGSTATVARNNLRSAHTRSCGCLVAKATREANKTHGEGVRRTKEYVAWYNMRQRCSNPNFPRFADYGGRGIKVCKRWAKYENFLQDMGRSPSKELTLEHLNNNLGYCKSNCCWATRKAQANNRRSSKCLTLK
jgi:hypothetical protein